MGTTARRIGWVVGLCALVSTGCSLEQALGVDGDGSSDGSTMGGGPGGSQGPSSGVDDTAGTAGQGTGSTGDPDGSTGPEPPAACQGQAMRVAAFNVERVGEQGSASFGALRAVIERIDADVVCLEEVEPWETAALFALAAEAGYSDVIQANEPPAIGGDLTNACMSRPGLSLVGSYSGWDLSSDADANDVGRDILVVRAQLGGEDLPPCGVGVVVLHLKSGQEPLDWFRRQVEAERVVQAVARYRDEHPQDAMVILGDLNESLDDPALGSVFDGLPDGLPPSYQLGSDIVLPLTYQPFATFEGLGFTIAPATQEDSARDETWRDLVRLDYVLHDDRSQLQGAEVYNACRDNGVDDPPAGQWLPKAGEPLDCAVSDEASDHFPVLVDLVLP